MVRSSKVVHSWCMYDWANSAFAATIMAAVFPIFYSTVAGEGLEKATATSYWGYTNTIAMLIVALSAPVLGAMADHLNAKKKFLAAFTGIGILATGFMVFITTGNWVLASLLYVCGRIGFSCANIFYDALLPHIAEEEQIDSISARGYAYGYMGGGILLIINLAMIMKPAIFGLSGPEWGTRLSFLTVSFWWGIFSLPLFLSVPEPYAPLKKIMGEKNILRSGFSRLQKTFKEIREYRELAIFLLAFWLYNDGIGTIIVMAVIFGTEIGIGQTDLIGAIVMVQFIGIPFALLFGSLSKRIGTKRSILIALLVYGMITVLGYFMETRTHFWVLAFLVATVQGGAQALSRSMFGSMTPKDKSAEFFGFYEVSSKFAGIAGPAIFALIGQVTGSSRNGILALIVFFIGGALLLTKVDHERGKEQISRTNSA